MIDASLIVDKKDAKLQSFQSEKLLDEISLQYISFYNTHLAFNPKKVKCILFIELSFVRLLCFSSSPDSQSSPG